VSDDFTWQQDPSARRRSAIRVGVVVACAGVGIAAGSYYPIKSVVTAFQRAHPQRVATQETLPAHQEQDSSRTRFMPAAAAPPPVPTEPNPPLQEAAGRADFFNPGTVAPPAAQDAKPTRSPSTAHPNVQENWRRFTDLANELVEYGCVRPGSEGDRGRSTGHTVHDSRRLFSLLTAQEANGGECGHGDNSAGSAFRLTWAHPQSSIPPGSALCD
jgi:hypothetical protein